MSMAICTNGRPLNFRNQRGASLKALRCHQCGSPLRQCLDVAVAEGPFYRLPWRGLISRHSKGGRGSGPPALPTPFSSENEHSSTLLTPPGSAGRAFATPSAKGEGLTDHVLAPVTIVT